VRPRSIDFRVIAATNQPLERLVQSGRFRTDLYYRLNVFVIEAPPLRDRRDDIPLLCDYFLSISDSGRQCILDDLALAELMKRQWRGNVRELRNVIEHAAVLARGGIIGLEHLPAESELPDDQRPRGDSLAKSIREWADRSMPSSVDTPEAEGADLYNRFLATVEPPLLESTLEKCGGNQTTAAAVLGIHRSTLRQKLRDAGLK
jgi:two-component system nitrogen regulation response regulator GlnG